MVWYPHDRRGVSNVLGLILLVGIISLGILIVAFAGSSTVSDQTSQNNVEIAQQVFEQADSQMSQLGSQGISDQQGLDIPDALEGQVETRQEAKYRVRLNDNPSCDSGSHPLGSLEYEDEGSLVGYQAGGVWQYNGNGGAAMRSPPDITYDDGQLSMSLFTLEGSVVNTDRVTMSVNTTTQNRFNENISKALYTNLSYDGTGTYNIACAPEDVRSATLYINNSQFANAWAQYARNNYDEDLVTVRPSGSLDPGQNLSITFALGDVSESNFEVSDIAYEHTGSAIRIDATIENTGGLSDTKEIQFQYSDGSTASTPVHWNGPASAPTVTLNGSEQKTVSVTMPTSEIEDDNSMDSFDVSTDADDASTPVRFDSTAPPSLTVDTEFVSANGNRVNQISPGATAWYNVSFENSGGMTARAPVEYQFDGSTTTTDARTFHPGTSTKVSFSIPTRDTGSFPVSATLDTATASNTTTINTAPYFDITSADIVRSNNDVPQEIEVEVTNRGGLAGSDSVTIEIIDQQTGSTVDSQSWSLDDVDPGNSRFRSLPVPSSPGNYGYRVITSDARTTGAFAIGTSSDKPNFVVNSTAATPNPVLNTSSLTVDYTITNAGDADGTTDVEVRLEQDSTGASVVLRDGTETITADNSYSGTVITNSLDTYAGFENDFAQVIVETDNTTASQYVEIIGPGQGINDSDGKIVVSRKTEARVLLLGSELSSSWYDWEWTGNDWEKTNFQILQWPTYMRLQVENSTGSYEVPLWESTQGGNVNHPEVRKDLFQSQTYERELTLEGGAKTVVYAKSHYCNYPGYGSPQYVPTSVQFPNADMDGDGDAEGAVGSRCTDPEGYDVAVNVDDLDNSNNVVILGDGEQVPAYQQAGPFQRGIGEMLPGDRINDNGVLDLKPGERLLLYELSVENADPDRADDVPDPDYNDAAVLFQTLGVNETRKTPAQIGIDDVDAPATAQRNSTFSVDVTLNNTGGQDGTAPLQLRFAGEDIETKQVDVAGKSEQTVTFSGVSTDGLAGANKYVVDITDDPGEQRSGYITVGTPQEATFQITEIDAPNVVDRRESPLPVQAEVTVTNTGGASGTQTVTLLSSGTVLDSSTETLSAGAETTIDMDLPQTTGENTYSVETDDATVSGQQLYIGEPEPAIVGIDVLSSSYGEGELIERTAASEMSVEVKNGDGSNPDAVGDTVDISLMINERSSGNTVFSDTKSVELGTDATRLSTAVPGWKDFSTGSSLGNGYYDYTIQVTDEGDVVDQWTGEMLLQNDADSGGSDSPIDVDSGQIVVSG